MSLPACGPGEVLVRNRTGIPQHSSTEGVTLAPGEWQALPRGRAYQMRNSLLVDLYLPEDLSHYTWKDEEGTHIFWMSPFSLGDGYGTGAEHTLNAAVDLGLNVQAQACWFLVRRGILPRTLKLLDTPPTRSCAVGVCLATPGEFNKLPTPYKIGWTMYESTDPLQVHPEWRHECNSVDRLFVPSQYSKEIFSSFLRKELPIDVVPLYVNPLYHVAQRREPKSTFTFITFATMTGRKAPVETARLFEKVFPRRKYPHVRLIFKTRLKMLGNTRKTDELFEDDRITAISGDWLADKMLRFMLDADCMLFLTYGEGFGLPPREAIATGLPTIFPAHTGMLEIADERYGWPVPLKKMETSPLGGEWSVPDWDVAMDTMRWMVHNPEKAFKRAQENAKRFLEERNAQAAQTLVDTLNKIDVPAELNAKWTRSQLHRGMAAGASREELEELARTHEAFLSRMLSEICCGQNVLLELGIRTGAHIAHLREAGHAVFGVARNPKELRVCRDNLSRGYDAACEAVLTELTALQLRHLYRDGLPTKYDACYSVGVLQQYTNGELKRVLGNALALTEHIYFSVPSTFHPGEAWEPSDRLMRREQWIDILAAAGVSTKYLEYYENRAYIHGCVIGQGQGGKRGVVGRHGYVRDGVWRPKEWQPGQ